MKRKIATILPCVLMTLCMSTTLWASNGDIELYRWENVSSMVGKIVFDKTSGNYSMAVSGASGVSKITATATLYYKNSSSEWVETSTKWTYSVDGRRLLIDEDFTGVSGREYKVELEATVYKNGNGEKVTHTSTKTCP